MNSIADTHDRSDETREALEFLLLTSINLNPSMDKYSHAG